MSRMVDMEDVYPRDYESASCFPARWILLGVWVALRSRCLEIEPIDGSRLWSIFVRWNVPLEICFYGIRKMKKVSWWNAPNCPRTLMYPAMACVQWFWLLYQIAIIQSLKAWMVMEIPQHITFEVRREVWSQISSHIPMYLELIPLLACIRFNHDVDEMWWSARWNTQRRWVSESCPARSSAILESHHILVPNFPSDSRVPCGHPFDRLKQRRCYWSSSACHWAVKNRETILTGSVDAAVSLQKKKKKAAELFFSVPKSMTGICQLWVWDWMRLDEWQVWLKRLGTDGSH